MLLGIPPDHGFGSKLSHHERPRILHLLRAGAGPATLPARCGGWRLGLGTTMHGTEALLLSFVGRSPPPGAGLPAVGARLMLCKSAHQGEFRLSSPTGWLLVCPVLFPHSRPTSVQLLSRFLPSPLLLLFLLLFLAG